MKKVWFTIMAFVLMTMTLPGYLYAVDMEQEEEAANPGAMSAAGEKESTAAATEKQRLEEEKRKVAEARKILVAKVNGQPISLYSLIRTMNKIAPRYITEEAGLTDEVTDQVKQEALDRLIYEELAVQEAERQKIEIDPQKLDKVIKKVRESMGTDEAFQAYLDNAGLTEESLRRQIARSQQFEIITAREIYSKVKVDEAQVREAYEKEKDRLIFAEKYLVEDVFFLPNDDEDAAKSKAEKILGMIKAQNNDVWKLVLDGTFIVRTIYIKPDRHPAIHAAMADMEVGDLSGVIKDKDGLHIFRVKEKEPSRLMTFEEAKKILEPRFMVPAQEARKAEWQKELLQNAEIEYFQYAGKEAEEENGGE